MIFYPQDYISISICRLFDIFLHTLQGILIIKLRNEMEARKRKATAYLREKENIWNCLHYIFIIIHNNTETCHKKFNIQIAYEESYESMCTDMLRTYNNQQKGIKWESILENKSLRILNVSDWGVWNWKEFAQHFSCIHIFEHQTFK